MLTPDSRIAPQHLTLDGVVAHWAALTPTAPALEYSVDGQPDRLDWAQFESLVRGAAEQLAATVGRGQTVAVVCEDSADFHILLNALWRCGAAVLLIDRSWGAAVVSDLLRLTGCTLLFRQHWSIIPEVATLTVLAYPARQAGTTILPSPSAGDDIALYATTSGTTDNPKCIAISHRRIRSAYRTCLTVHDFSGVRRAACLFQINSLGVLGVCFLLPREVGAATRAFPSFNIANIRATWAEVLASGIDFVYVVPPLVRLLNRLPAPSSREKSLLVFCAAAPVQREELRSFETHFPVTVFNSYGLTELTFAVFFGCRDADGLASESIGFPVGIQARLLDDRGDELEGAGHGELLITGVMLTDGYLHNPAATAEAWSDGWLRTGDIAERDADGRYFIRGRKKDVVLRGGITYYLHELEHYLRRSPDVVDVCAFRGRDLPSGDELCVVVQVARPTSNAALLDWIRQQMGESKIPNVLYVWEQALPRNSNGKVQRPQLARLHLEGALMSRTPEAIAG